MACCSRRMVFLRRLPIPKESMSILPIELAFINILMLTFFYVNFLMEIHITQPLRGPKLLRDAATYEFRILPTLFPSKPDYSISCSVVSYEADGNRLAEVFQ